MMRFRARRPLSTVLLAALLTAVMPSGCDADQRPEPAAWRATWDGVRDRLPSLEELAAGSARELCSDTLAMLREEAPSLTPTPDLAIDDVVTEWIRIAEGAFFECPLRSGEIDTFEKAYAELGRLEAEVAVVLEIDTSS